MERRELILRHARDLLPSGGLESSQRNSLERSLLADASDDDERARIETALDGARAGPDDPEVVGGLEALVIPRVRPMVDIVGDRYEKPRAPWTRLDRPEYRSVIEPLLPSVGCVELPDQDEIPYVGTAFVVGDGLMMTNRHVAESFVDGVGTRQLHYHSAAVVDLTREREPRSPVRVEVVDVRMMHPYWDMALLAVRGLPERSKPLVLDVTAPPDLGRREIVLVGYPGWDSRNAPEDLHHVFRGHHCIKRLQPGYTRGRRTTHSQGHTVSALAHDSSTTGGNSGSAVIDAGNGRVLGLHFGGRYLVMNHAVPSSELARDGRVIDAGVRFSATPKREQVEWEHLWTDQ